MALPMDGRAAMDSADYSMDGLPLADLTDAPPPATITGQVAARVVPITAGPGGLAAGITVGHATVTRITEPGGIS